ncbi:MAG: ferredoxin-thioredoxin reductase [Gemmatimonadaceae bacterium]|nr:ferredoxin-thioredoxin reductase [Gloeobacterales cyanobacterium ES-bin-141]
MTRSGDENKASPASFALTRHFAESYASKTGTYFCSVPTVTTAVLEGLALHREKYGAMLCPCRYYEDPQAEVAAAYWNCPCVPMRERKECHCLLFLPPDHPFAGTSQTVETIDLQYES